MKIVAVINAFNEKHNILRAIQSVYDYVDEVRVFDGAYKEYPHENHLSTDGMNEMLERYTEEYPKVKVLLHTGAYENQNEKRTNMFQYDSDNIDYFIRLDADEEIVNPELLKNLDWGNFDTAWVWMHSNLYLNGYMKPVVFRNIKGMHYAGRHHWLFNGNNKLICSDQNMTPKYKHIDTPIRVYNYRSTRKTDREDSKKQLLVNRTWEHEVRNENDVYKTITHLIPHPNRAGKPRKPSFYLKRPIKPEEIENTFSLMFTRSWAVKKYFDRLAKLQIPEKTEIITVIDSDDKNLYDDICKELMNERISSKFDGIKVYFTGIPKPEEMAKVAIRRQRISTNWNIILTEALGTYLLGGEDDSLPMHVDTYEAFLDAVRKDECDFIQGNIIGRWGAKIPPAWKIEKGEDGLPNKVYNLLNQSEGASNIEACGWYCFATKLSLFRKYPMYYSNDLLPLGPDLRHGYLMSNGGATLLHSWKYPVEHFGEDFSLIPADIGTEKLTWSLISKDLKRGIKKWKAQ